MFTCIHYSIVHCTFFISQFAKSFAQDKPVTTAHLCHHLHWPLPHPYTPDQMAKLEEAHEVLDLYLWFR